MNEDIDLVVLVEKVKRLEQYVYLLVQFLPNTEDDCMSSNAAKFERLHEELRNEIESNVYRK